MGDGDGRAVRLDLADLVPGEETVNYTPPQAEIRRLVDEFHAVWIRNDVALAQLPSFVYAQLGLAGGSVPFEAFEGRMSVQRYRLYRLSAMLAHEGMLSGGLSKKLNDVAFVLFDVPKVMVALSRTIASVNSTASARATLPPPLREAGAERQGEENVFDHDESKNNSFQNLYFYLREVLYGCLYRRADNKFFTRIRTKTGYDTLAFEQSIAIDQFVLRHAAPEQSFRAFRWVTDSKGNFAEMVKWLGICVLPEAPDLDESCRYRSYEGDAVGRGAGVYDCREDFFFPYAERSTWADMAEQATLYRRKLYGDASYAMEPPRDTDVCVVHLQGCFPYDTLQELVTVIQTPLAQVWREADAHECANPRNAIDHSPDLAERLDELLPPDAADVPDACGETWQVACASARLREWRDWVRLNDDPARQALVEHLCRTPGVAVPAELRKDLGARCYAETPHGTLVPLFTPAARPRARLSDEELGRFEARQRGRPLHVGSFMRHGERFFRVDSGRTWHECAAPEIDRIYECQKFTAADRHMLYALKGRLFFEVGELDSFEMTFMLEGIGGCGKSTIMKAWQLYWPPHLRGILSSNMQPQFGMAAVARDGKAKVIFCDEVSESLQIVQEEWQTSVSGSIGSYAVKNQQQPLVIPWIAQHFWVGNQFCKKFNNLQGQVSRRIAGVNMTLPVRPRDGNILKNITSYRLPTQQRKAVLAYREFLRIHGSTDPMSQPERLPPAFCDYYRRGRQQTNPVESFLDSEMVVLDPMGTMLMKELKATYDAYRNANDLPGRDLKWGEDRYRTPFIDRGIAVVRRDRHRHHDGIDYSNVEVVTGVRLPNAADVAA